MKQWQCSLCGFVYDEKFGRPDDGIEPETPWDQVPSSWTCPDCTSPKEDFIPIES